MEQITNYKYYKNFIIQNESTIFSTNKIRQKHHLTIFHDCQLINKTLISFKSDTRGSKTPHQ